MSADLRLDAPKIRKIQISYFLKLDFQKFFRKTAGQIAVLLQHQDSMRVGKLIILTKILNSGKFELS